MSGFLLDTNVLLDIATADPAWLAWSEGQFRAAAAQGPLLINPIIYAELAPAFATQSDLDQWLDPAVFQRLPLPYAAGWLAARTGGFASTPVGRLEAAALLSLPLLFSGIVFSTLLSTRGPISSIMGMNLLGAIVGGLLEYNSMYLGFQALYLMAMLCYVLAFVSEWILARSSRAYASP